MKMRTVTFYLGAALLGPAASLKSASVQNALVTEQQDLGVTHVAYATTKDGFPGLLHSMSSLAHYLPEGERCTIHIIVKGDQMELAKSVVDCYRRETAAYKVQPNVTMHEMNELPWDTSRMMSTPEGRARSWGHQQKLSNPTVFARFYLANILATQPRVLWLDVDTIVHSNVGELYRRQMSHTLAARVAKESTVKDNFPGWSCASHLDGDKEFSYFNTGVLVIDLERWRRNHFTEQLEKKAEECVCNDQPAFNIVFIDEGIDKLEKTWNSVALGSTVKARTKRVANILHWSGPTKPWEEASKCHNPGQREFDTDCLSADNYADYAEYDPKQSCPAVPVLR